jgi:hypothetical protein
MLSRMTHPLDSAYLKLSRAAEHLKEIEAEARLFVTTNPYVPVPEYNFKTGQHAVVVRVLAEPPMHLGLLAGDALHNIRSALDHLTYQLAGLPSDRPRGKKTQYPIFTTPEAFDAMPDVYLDGVPDVHRAAIRMAQPYDPRYRLLEPLARLSNRDKHRIIDPLASSALGMTLHATPADAIYDIRGFSEVVYFDDRAVLATFRSDREVDVEIRDFAFYIRFGTRDKAGLGMEGIHLLIQQVSEILAQFRAAFD